ncbi:MAG: hypothetical protein V7703_12190 [Hyphomicrobiales bacterium]
MQILTGDMRDNAVDWAALMGALRHGNALPMPPWVVKRHVKLVVFGGVCG